MVKIKIFIIFSIFVFINRGAIAQTQQHHMTQQKVFPVLEDGKPRGLPYDDNAQEKYNTGWSLHIDNDLLVPGSVRDQDYTGGLGFTLAGRRAKESNWSLDVLLGWADGISYFDQVNLYDKAYVMHAAQIGLLIFSPSDIGESRAIYDDRPFANLVYIANSRRVVIDPLSDVYQSTMTLGVLGTQVGVQVQNSLHDMVGANTPNGWDHQISDGGELTFQYSASRQSLLSSNFQQANTEYEIKYGLAASVGYITETSIAISGRWGYINTPWWSFTPENADYASQPAPVIGDSIRKNCSEFYLWSGLKLRARAYNVFLQGQFRDSEVTFDYDELNHLIAEAWVGVTSQIDFYRLSYVIRYQTKEIRRGVGARDPVWGGVILSADF